MVPVSVDNVARYIAYLSRSKKFSTVKQYTNVIRLLHLENSFANPLENNWRVQTLLRGVKRVKGDETVHKLPLTPVHLLAIRHSLDFSSLNDCLFWAVLLTGFFGLLRISNLTCGNASVLTLSSLELFVGFL